MKMSSTGSVNRLKKLVPVAVLLVLLAGCVWPGSSSKQTGPEEDPTAAEEPKVEEPAEVSMVFVGDIMLDRIPGQALAEGADPLASFASVFEEADLSVGNLECVVATVGQKVPKLYNFQCHPRTIGALTPYLDAVTIANNHIGDYGPDALLQAMELMKEGNLGYFGGGANAQEAHEPLILERNGIRIALLGYNEVELQSYEAGPDSPGLAWSHDDQVAADIAAAKDKADFVVVYPHWGLEYHAEPSQRQQDLARAMVDAGADLVVGSHPHRTQTVEWYNGSLIVYSLGNFVFDDFMDVPASLDEPSRTSWVLQVTATKEGVQAWSTLVARTDDSGIPRPVENAESPSGTKPEAD